MKNQVLEKLKPRTEVKIFDRKSISKGYYNIRISSRDVFIEMMNSYTYSFDRKRPDKYKSGKSNYLGDIDE